MEGRNKSISYYFNQMNKNEKPCKLNFLKSNETNNSLIKTTSKANLNKSTHKRPITSSLKKQPTKSKIFEKMREGTLNTYLNNSRNIRPKSKEFNNNSINISFSRPINNTTEELSQRTLSKIKVLIIYIECKKYFG